ncbi:hypothetical protein QFZ83_005728 [Variovorax sp. W1I1]|uniref:hypothetical protein n=1 Tax=Variovorax sp. W1I1 TaxID=3042309 RepID=UPI00278A3F02|nr:hypothetical protein [Variovorax sp. W1I1]MDQ0611557.1 hypothetical protein [Variovorax sp. W1I1]
MIRKARSSLSCCLHKLQVDFECRLNSYWRSADDQQQNSRNYFSNEASVWFGVPGFSERLLRPFRLGFLQFLISALNTKSSTVASLPDFFHSFYSVITLDLKLKRIESFSIAWKFISAQAESPQLIRRPVSITGHVLLLFLDFY